MRMKSLQRKLAEAASQNATEAIVGWYWWEQPSARSASVFLPARGRRFSRREIREYSGWLMTLDGKMVEI